MRITVTVTPNAKKAEVVETGPDAYRVKVDAPAVENKANIRLITLMAEHFNVSKSNVLLMKGITSRQKVLEVIGITPKI